jgi:hypothetical protein
VVLIIEGIKMQVLRYSLWRFCAMMGDRQVNDGYQFAGDLKILFLITNSTGTDACHCSFPLCALFLHQFNSMQFG